jgi:hypothetical protein
MTVLLPKLLRASFRAWVLLSERLEEARLCPDNMRKDTVGLLGYAVCSLARTGPYTVRIVVTALDGADEVALEAPAGEGPLQFPLEETPGLIPSALFLGLLTSCSQAHALGWLVLPCARNFKLVNIAIGPSLWRCVEVYARSGACV